MQQDGVLPFDLPAVACKKVSVAFDGGMLSSDAGVLLLRDVERRLGIAARLAACLSDHRDPNRIDHTLVECLCQKHPLTSITFRRDGNTISGVPGSSRLCRRNRYPMPCSRWRTTNSGLVLRGPMRDINALRSGSISNELR